MNDLQNEWAIIHADIEKYERFSLIIKLFSVLTSVLCTAYLVDIYFSLAFIFILWLQDSIWKTFQKRIETRILFIEKQLNESLKDSNKAFQFYSQWESTRQGITGLIKEYVSSAVKPTVAYPYAILIFLMLVFY